MIVDAGPGPLERQPDEPLVGQAAAGQVDEGLT